MSPTAVEILFEAVNLLLLAAGLWWLLFQPVRAALAREVGARTEQEAELQRRREAVDADAAALAARRDAFERDQVAEHDRRVAATEAETEQRVAEADRRIAAARAAFETERAQRLADATRETATMAATVSADAVTALLGQIDGPDLQLALARRALDVLGDGATRGAWVEAASPLEPEVRALLSERLPGFDLRERADLVAGLRIGTDAGMVDCTAAGMARAAADALAVRLQDEPRA